MRKLYNIFLITTMALAWPGFVFADIIGSWLMKGGGQMTIEFRDQDNFRINMGSEGYALMSQGKAFMVSRSHKGEWEAISVDSMKRMMGQSGFGSRVQATRPDDLPVHFEKTNRVEQIAGITGQVYLLTTDRPSGGTETVEAVFGDDPRLVSLQEANVRFSHAWGVIGGKRDEPFSEIMKKYKGRGPGGGMLRYGDAMRLVSLQDTQLASSRFQLPRLIQMDVPPAMPQRPRRGEVPVATVPSSSEEEGRLSKSARRVGDSAAKEAEGVVTEKTRESVREGMDSFFKSIFGN